MGQEEKAILLAVERALASSPNAQTIGRNGEIPFLKFLQRYLPSTLKAISGHFITPSGAISPQLDVIVMDARYPLLAENADGSALVMLQSVVCVFEIKTNLTTRDLKKTLSNAAKLMELASEVEELQFESWSSFHTALLAYNTSQRIERLEEVYFANCEPTRAVLEARVLRYHPADQLPSGGVGGLLQIEPPFPEEGGTGPLPGGWFPLSISSHTPLSDLYYQLVQDCYYTIGERDYSFHQIGAQFNDYMSWATARC